MFEWFIVAKEMFPKAKLILEPGGYDACYTHIVKGTAHATIGKFEIFLI
jgi:hypothetical protein